MSEAVERGNREKQGNDQLPEGWVWTTMKNICHVERGITFPSSAKKSNPDNDAIACLRTSNVQYMVDWDDLIYVPKTYVKDYSKLVQQDDILISMANSLELVGKVSFVEYVQVYSTFGAFISAIRSYENTYAKYLFYALRTNKTKNRLREASSQTVNIANLSLGRLEPVPIPLAPFSEQKSIVEAIETQFTRLDAAVKTLEQAQIKLERYRASVLQAACEGRLVPTEAELAQKEGRDYEPAEQLLERILAERRRKWKEERWAYEIERAKKKAAQAERKAAGLPYYIRELEPEHWQDRAPEEYEPYLPKSDKWKEKYDEPEPPDTDDLPALPEGWVWVTMPQVGELGRGRSRHRPRNDEKLFGGPYPFIQTGEVREAEGTVTDYTQTYNETGLSQSKLWPKGTLCITIAANIAETALLGFDACFPDSVVGFIPEDGVLARFFDYYIRTMQQQLETNAPATAQKNINLTTLSALPIPLPPLYEQKRIVAEVERRLSIIKALEETVTANLTRAERMRQAILKKAFEGRLVEQRLEEEPASALLERIQKETSINR